MFRKTLEVVRKVGELVKLSIVDELLKFCFQKNIEQLVGLPDWTLVARMNRLPFVITTIPN